MNLNATVAAAIITGSVTAIGWLTTKTLDTRSQRRLKNLEFRRAYVQSQIEEFYGPLYSLMWQIFNANELKERLLSNRQLVDSERKAIDDFFAETQFNPLHGRIKTILENKLYLLEGTQVPTSLFKYLTHSLQESAQHRLWSEKGISTQFLRGTPFPSEFYDLIEATLKNLLIEYESSVQELKAQATKPERPVVAQE
jgi:hypothetical protein